MATKYKLLKPLQLSGKMVVNAEQSEVLQEELLRLGYEWIMHEGSKHLDKPFIIWRPDESLGFLYDDQEVFFNDLDDPLHSFNDYFKKQH